jgi:ribosome-associated translation inhibitor RaiA
MQLPLQVTFRGMPRSEAVEAKIQERAHKLDTFHGRIMGCHVVVESPHRHHHKGRSYVVSIDFTVPGGEVVVNRDPGSVKAHDDIYVAIRDAFNAAARRLEDYARKQRGKVKRHDTPTHARVTRLFPLDGYGFAVTPDELEVYFHERAVSGITLDKLNVGDEVRLELAETESDKGPQATTVQFVGKRHGASP